MHHEDILVRPDFQVQVGAGLAMGSATGLAIFAGVHGQETFSLASSFLSALLICTSAGMPKAHRQIAKFCQKSHVWNLLSQPYVVWFYLRYMVIHMLGWWEEAIDMYSHLGCLDTRQYKWPRLQNPDKAFKLFRPSISWISALPCDTCELLVKEHSETWSVWHLVDVLQLESTCWSLIANRTCSV